MKIIVSTEPLFRQIFPLASKSKSPRESVPPSRQAGDYALSTFKAYKTPENKNKANSPEEEFIFDLSSPKKEG